MEIDKLQAALRDGQLHWEEPFDERQRKEIQFDRIYALSFAHGTDGHNARLIIARMATLLDWINARNAFRGEDKAG